MNEYFYLFNTADYSASDSSPRVPSWLSNKVIWLFMNYKAKPNNTVDSV